MSLSQTFQALSEPNRRKILDTLKKHEMPVAKIAADLDITLPTLSHHLDILKRANLVSGRRKGQQILYSLNLSALREITKQVVKLLATK